MNKSILVFIVLFSSIGWSQYVEEQSTLESLYETRARSVLNTLFRPHDYTVVISAEMEKDAKKLKDYQDQIELQYLPGLPMPADPAQMPATNTLHEMKTKIMVDVILDISVPKDKESLLKSLLNSKLHLDEANGDLVNIQRASLKDPETIPKQDLPSVLPEFTWKMWVLVLLVTLSLVAAAIFWSNRRRQNQKEESLPKDPAPPQSLVFPYENPQAPAQQPEALPAEPVITLEDLLRMKDRLLTLVTQIPQLCSRSLSDYLDEGHDLDVILVFEHLGWDLSKKLFPAVPARVWGRLGSNVRNKDMTSSLEKTKQAYENLYRFFLSRFLNSGVDTDETNPFGFLFKLSASERNHVLDGESAANFAIISMFSNKEEMAALQTHMSIAVQSLLPVEIARLETLPDSTVQVLAGNLQKKLEIFKKSPTYELNSIEVAARLLRSYSPEKESEVYRKMLQENPEQADRIRRLNVQFTDLLLYPTEMTSVALNYFEVDDLVKAFKNLPAEFCENLLALMPPKRANMIRTDLQSPAVVPTPVEVARLRRSLVLKVEEMIRSQGLTMAEVWEQIEVKFANKKLKVA